MRVAKQHTSKKSWLWQQRRACGTRRTL